MNVKYVKSMDDRFERKGNVAYFFEDEESGNLYKWSTSYNNHYGLCEGKKYSIKFCKTNDIEDNAIRITHVKIYEILMNGELMLKTNKRGTYKEWM